MPFIEPCQLVEGERIVKSWLANRTQNRARAVGGKLTLTTMRLIFIPHAVDAAFAGERWELTLDHVRAVGVMPRRFSLTEMFTGGWRNRLAIESSTGEVDLFVVNRVDKCVAIIADCLPQSSVQPTFAKLT